MRNIGGRITPDTLRQWALLSRLGHGHFTTPAAWPDSSEEQRLQPGRTREDLVSVIAVEVGSATDRFVTRRIKVTNLIRRQARRSPELRQSAVKTSGSDHSRTDSGRGHRPGCRFSTVRASA